MMNNSMGIRWCRCCILKGLMCLMVSVQLIQLSYAQVKSGNPLVPGYFADPTIKKFGDTYYLYATTDGIKLASGEPQVWLSTDFVNWYNFEMEVPLPEGLTNCWAPDVVKGKNGKYYYFIGNCQEGCNIYGYVSDFPIGPWQRLNNGHPVIEAGTGIMNLPALDAQYLWVNDTQLYAFFGTWCTSFKGMGWASIDPQDMITIKESGYIPIGQIPLAFEAAYPLKKNQRYILMYSSGDCRLSTYAVRYAYSDSPVGPYTEGLNNPLLCTSADGTIDAPGHHSVLYEEGNAYIIYHRHDNPHSTGGEFRQVCADSLIFENDSTIRKINAGHTGIGYLGPNTTPPNLASKVQSSASSYYHLISPPTRFAHETDYKYSPENAVDDNNGTMWKAGNGILPQSLTLDLGYVFEVKRIITQFEYPTFYYCYTIEYSTDSIHWLVYSDKTSNRISGSPMIDDFNAKARYLRITITASEKSGMYAAIWNIKVYDTLFDVPDLKNKASLHEPGSTITNRLLVNLDAGTMNAGPVSHQLLNTGALGGVFIKSGNPVVEVKDHIKALSFDGESHLRLSKNAPENLGWNAAYTAAAWVLNPTVGFGECILVWNSRENMLQASYAALMYGTGPFGAMAHGDGYVDVPFKTIPSADQWHHVAVVFDGMMETVYVDGLPDTRLPLNLFVEAGTIIVGSSGEESENFSGYIANLQLMDSALTSVQINELMHSTKPAPAMK